MTQKISIPQNEKTFYRSYNFAKSSVNIIFQDLSIVTQFRTILLLQILESWDKETGNEHLDLTIGCQDDAEVCDLFNSFISNKLAYISNISSIALYRDDGLGIFQNVSKPETEKKKKTIVNFF